MVSSSRPRTPSHGSSSTSPPSATDKLANISDAANAHPPRRSSLGLLLRRSKSGEFKPSKKQQAIAREQELERQQREAAAIPKSPPRLPDLYNGQKQPTLPFGGGGDDNNNNNNNNNSNSNNNNNNNNNNNTNNMRPDSVAIVSNRAEPYQHARSSMDPGRSASGAAVANVPIPPIPSNGHRNGAWVDPYARTESMTHRGRYSYASSAVSSINSPRRVRRRRDPTPFNILIIGARSSGKTSFLNFLETSLALPQKKKSTRPNELHDDIFAPQSVRAGKYESHYLETEIEGERIGLTIWDSEGLEKNVVDLQLREMSTFLESKFEETFTEEMKVVRAPGVQDTHIHCAFLLLDPLRLDRNIAQDKTNVANGGSVNGKYNAAPRLSGGLDEDLDLQVLRTLQGKTTVVPVISKADTITTAHMNYLKKTVWDSLRQANLDPLEALGLDDDDDEPESPGKPDRIDEGDEDEDDDDDDDDDEDRVPGDDLPIQNPEPQTSPRSNRLSTGSVRRHKEDSGELPYFPLSVISPDIYEPGVIGRKFPWGFADPLNAEHCDFVRLKEAVFTEWRGELREASRDLWYEQWRTSRLKHRESRR